jgi:hypothetical protein
VRVLFSLMGINMTPIPYQEFFVIRTIRSLITLTE